MTVNQVTIRPMHPLMRRSQVTSQGHVQLHECSPLLHREQSRSPVRKTQRWRERRRSPGAANGRSDTHRARGAGSHIAVPSEQSCSACLPARHDCPSRPHGRGSNRVWTARRVAHTKRQAWQRPVSHDHRKPCRPRTAHPARRSCFVGRLPGRANSIAAGRRFVSFAWSVRADGGEYR